MPKFKVKGKLESAVLCITKPLRGEVGIGVDIHVLVAAVLLFNFVCFFFGCKYMYMGILLSKHSDMHYIT